VQVGGNLTVRLAAQLFRAEEEKDILFTLNIQSVSGEIGSIHH